MKNPVIKIINYLEAIKQEKPTLYKIIYYSLWVIAFEEMLCIKFGIFTYKKLSARNDKRIFNEKIDRLSQEIREDLK